MDKYKKKNMDTENSLSLEIQEKNKEIISYFDKDNDFVFAYKKTEKLVTAVYMITNLFSDSEPMKWTLRKKSGDILSFILSYKDIVLSDYKNFSETAKTKILELVSLLEISSRSGMISFMNYSILKQEFENLIKKIDASGSEKETARNSLSKSFFYVSEQARPIQNFPISTEKTDAQLSDISRANPIENIKDKSVFKRTNRQEVILNLLKKKKDLTIKDISHVITNCSEKTIQRELIALISAGIIKKTGERRWSKYSLN